MAQRYSGIRAASETTLICDTCDTEMEVSNMESHTRATGHRSFITSDLLHQEEERRRKANRDSDVVPYSEVAKETVKRVIQIAIASGNDTAIDLVDVDRAIRAMVGAEFYSRVQESAWRAHTISCLMDAKFARSDKVGVWVKSEA